LSESELLNVGDRAPDGADRLDSERRERDLTTPRRVLLIEDDSALRSRLAAALRLHPRLRIVGEADAAEAALALLREGLEVDVALEDLRLPGMSGQELIATAKAAWPRIELVVLTGFADDDSIYEALRAGATGYLLKDAGPAAIASAIDEVCDGGAPMSPGIARRLLAGFHARRETLQPHLTHRERQVLDLLTRGASYALIGQGLGITTSTVQSHIRAIYRKLEVSTKSEATLVAIRRGYLR
jgi:DNA-binding NarL/FixJ family response regulator